MIVFLLRVSVQRSRKRRSSDCSDDGHHSDGDYSEHDYRGDPADEKESKTIMLRGLPVNITETDVSTKT